MITSAPHPFFIFKKLNPLLVIPLIDIRLSGIFITEANFEIIFDLYFEIFGLFNTIEASILIMLILLGIIDIIFFNKKKQSFRLQKKDPLLILAKKNNNFVLKQTDLVHLLVFHQSLDIGNAHL